MARCNANCLNMPNPLIVNKTSETWRHATIITISPQRHRSMQAVSRQLALFEVELQSTIDSTIRRCAWNNWSCGIRNASIQPVGAKPIWWMDFLSKKSLLAVYFPEMCFSVVAINFVVSRRMRHVLRRGITTPPDNDAWLGLYDGFCCHRWCLKICCSYRCNVNWTKGQLKELHNKA